MRVVVDEGAPRQLVRALSALGVDASRFRADWRGRADADLIAAVAAMGFDALVTNDKNIVHQRGLGDLPIAIVSLPLNRRRPIVERADDVAATLRLARRGQHVAIEIDGRRVVTTFGAGESATTTLPPLRPFGQ